MLLEFLDHQGFAVAVLFRRFILFGDFLRLVLFVVFGRDFREMIFALLGCGYKMLLEHSCNIHKLRCERENYI